MNHHRWIIEWAYWAQAWGSYRSRPESEPLFEIPLTFPCLRFQVSGKQQSNFDYLAEYLWKFTGICINGLIRWLSVQGRSCNCRADEGKEVGHEDQVTVTGVKGVIAGQEGVAGCARDMFVGQLKNSEGICWTGREWQWLGLRKWECGWREGPRSRMWQLHVGTLQHYSIKTGLEHIHHPMSVTRQWRYTPSASASVTLELEINKSQVSSNGRGRGQYEELNAGPKYRKGEKNKGG